MIANIKRDSLSRSEAQEVFRHAVAQHRGCDGFAIFNGNHAHGGYQYLCLNPVLKLECNVQGSHEITANGAQIYPDPWEALSTHLSTFTQDGPDVLHDVPLLGGFFGYEFLQHVEPSLRNAVRQSELPLYVLYLYSRILIIPSTPETPPELLSVSYTDYLAQLWESTEILSSSNVKTPVPPTISPSDLESILSAGSNFSRADYCNAVVAILDHIRDGDVYQANLSQEFTFPYEGDPWHYFQALQQVSPAPYTSYLSIRSSNSHCSSTIISASPELFFKRSGERVLCSPIKGTRRRDNCKATDLALREDLRTNPKDRAELAMIVDLMRNDLGRVAVPGSVEVVAFPREESFAQVHHLIGDVRAQIESETSNAAVLRALFPCGSITGAPKIAAIRILHSLERSARGVYTGCIGHFGFNNSAEFNVAIRTATISNNLLRFHTGGGIVIDSKPELEYEESLAKAAGLVGAMRISN